MLPKNRPSVFDIPELVALIASHLMPYDLAQCVASSKSLLHQFEPYLWGLFAPEKAYLEDTAGLTRNLHHIKSINLGWRKKDYIELLTKAFQGLEGDEESGLTTPKISACTNLKRINLRDAKDDDQRDIATIDQSSLSTLLRFNRKHLTHLGISSFCLKGVASSPEWFVKMMSELTSLESLVIRESWELSMAMTAALLESSLVHPCLTEIWCEFPVGDNKKHCYFGRLDGGEIKKGGQLDGFNSRLENILSAAAVARSRCSATTASIAQIKSLRLPAYPYAASILLRLLESNILNLERFHIPKVHEPDFLDLMFDDVPSPGSGIQPHELEAVVARRCPRLQHLSCSDCKSLIVQAVIRGCVNSGATLVSFKGEPSRFMIESPEYQFPIEILVESYASRLQEVVLLGRHGLLFAEMQMVLMSCRNLRKYWVEPSETMCNIFGQRKDYYFDKEWVCLGLEELNLILPFERLWAYGSPESRARSITHWIFEQVGRLKALKAVSLLWPIGISRFRDLDKQVWLRQLRDLKRLQSFEMQANIWKWIRQAEMEIMLNQWPMLNTIKLGCESNDDGGWPESASDEGGRSHWNWIQEQRPWLRVCRE
ncbi:hypothetical protein BG011_002378 [Mortierella polycephala]|uniref:Uncharacterized protein n=1 Tax=Mortierella polycephala TaxID=41804 RepID=A0A9P6Q3D2_9FUNG|nr:hypothetical protein BG011_002378 [Mortierella polycephala]